MQFTTASMDHLVVTAPSLDAGAVFVQQALGFTPGPGRKHVHMGTHNRLLSLGPSVYLEVVAIDPDAAPVARPRWFGLGDAEAHAEPRLSAWVASTTDIQASASPEFGAVERMAREGLSWQMTVTADGQAPLSGAAPLLIQRATAVHPASRLPDLGLRLRRLRVRHPDPGRVARLLARIGLADAAALALEPGPRCTLAAEIETPHGLMMLGEA